MRSAARQVRTWSEEEGDVGTSSRDNFDVRQIALCFQQRALSRLFAMSDHPAATRRPEEERQRRKNKRRKENVESANEMASRLKIGARTVPALVAWCEPQCDDLLETKRASTGEICGRGTSARRAKAGDGCLCDAKLIVRLSGSLCMSASRSVSGVGCHNGGVKTRCLTSTLRLRRDVPPSRSTTTIPRHKLNDSPVHTTEAPHAMAVSFCLLTAPLRRCSIFASRRT